MPRPKKATRSHQWTVYVPEDLATKIDLFFIDPLHEKIRYGYRSQLINQLLRRWLEDKVKEGPFNGDSGEESS